MKNPFLAVALSLLVLTTACKHTPTDQADASVSATDTTRPSAVVAAPEWARNATIYEINTRQFSAAGTFRAVEAQLPRLRELGADIIWLMPIYPISQKNKKGTLGSPYAVADYKTVNPDYGTLADFKALVRRAHALGLRVILDWVPNHTGWDHPWVREHPDWYTRVAGKLTAPIDPKTGKASDWTDVVDLNYDNPDLRRAMIDAMRFWVKECDIDGYRCDVAGLVPNAFWAELHPQLSSIKPVFMLAEWEDDPAQFRSCFNMNYAWSLFTVMKAVAQAGWSATHIDSLREVNQKRFPAGYYQMLYTQNHDQNARDGTLTETFGAGANAFVVLSSTLEGMPLVYNGMESNLDKRLVYFEKDSIPWGNYAKSDFFKTLLTLKHRNRALWNGSAGGPVVKIPTDHDDRVYAFYRHRDNDRVVVILNLGNQPQNVRLSGDGYEGTYTEVFSRQAMAVKPEMLVSLRPWEFRVLTN